MGPSSAHVPRPRQPRIHCWRQPTCAERTRIAPPWIEQRSEEGVDARKGVAGFREEFPVQRPSARHKKTRPVAPAPESVSPGQLIEDILNLSVGHCEGYIKV